MYVIVHTYIHTAAHGCLNEPADISDTCRVPKVMRNITRECHKFGNLLYEEGRDFGLGWNASLAKRRPFNLKEYQHRSASSLDSYPFWGDLGWYGGGGYVLLRCRLCSAQMCLL